jgi:hypothetical protein
MIPRTLQRRLSRVEALVEDAVEKKRRREADKSKRPWAYALIHATEVAALVLHGDVDINEPLSQAHRRAENKVRDLVGHDVERYLREAKQGRFDPLALYPQFWLHTLPGEDEKSKFASVFASAPVWLLKYTSVQRDAALLGFELPDLSAAPALGRKARAQRDRWPFLPDGTIYDGGPCDDPDPHLSTEELLTRDCFLY